MGPQACVCLNHPHSSSLQWTSPLWVLYLPWVPPVAVLSPWLTERGQGLVAKSSHSEHPVQTSCSPPPSVKPRHHHVHTQCRPMLEKQKLRAPALFPEYMPAVSCRIQ